MKIVREPAPEGTTCNRSLNYMDDNAPLCGKPAVIMEYPEEPELDDVDDRILLCDDCRIERLRRQSLDDQENAFETEHGWPPGMDVLDLAYSLGLVEVRFQHLLDLNAPCVIIKNERFMRIKREERILSWLEAHPPSKKHDTHLQAINALIESFEENYRDESPKSEVSKTTRAGLKRVRELGSLIDEESLPQTR